MKQQNLRSLLGTMLVLCLSLWARGQTPITITGNDTMCVNSTGGYFVGTPTANVTYYWSTTLGTIQGPTTSTATNILWGSSGGTATITVDGYDASNNLVETGSKNVELVSLALPTIYTDYRVACIKAYDNDTSGSGGEPSPPDTLFLDDAHGCPKVCEDVLVTYGVIGSGGQYRWTAIGGTIQGSSTGSSVAILWGPAGAGSLTVEEYYGQCTVKRTLCIDIIEKPRAAFAVTPNLDTVLNCDTFDLCLDSKIAFNNYSFGTSNSQIVSYYWDWGDGYSSAQKVPPPHGYPGPGYYQVQLIVTNECGCTDTTCAWVNVYQDPGPNILCQAVACEGDSVQYCTDAARCSAYNWQVVNGTIVTNNGDCITVLWDNIAGTNGFGYVSLDVNCPGLCAAPTTIKVPVVQKNPIITGPTKLCVGNQYKFSIPLWPGTEYTWGVLNNPSVIVNNVRKSNDVLLKFTAAGTYDVHVSWQNHITLCGGDTTFPVTVQGNDVINGPTVACKSTTPVTYQLGSASSTGWELVAPGGSTTTGSGTTFGAVFTTTGIYTLYATDYCATPLEIEVTEVTDIVDSIVGEDTVCLNKPYSYTAYSVAPGNVIEWDLVGGTIIGSNVGGSVTVVWTGPSGGQLAARQKSTTYPYCTGTYATLNIYPDNVDPDITGPDTVCSDSYNPYDANYQTTGATYTWSVDPNTAGNVQSGTYDPSIVFKANKVAAPTGVHLMVEVKKCGLTIRDTFNLVVMPEFLPEIQTTMDTFCSGDTVDIWTDAGALEYDWTFGDGSKDETDTPGIKHIYWNPTSNVLKRSIYVEAKDSDGTLKCPPHGFGTKDIYIRPGPTVVDTALDTTIYCSGDTVATRLQATGGNLTGSPNYQWYYYSNPMGTASPIPGATSNIYTATGAGFFYCVITDAATGCRGIGNVIHIEVFACSGSGCPGLDSLVLSGGPGCKTIHAEGYPNPSYMGGLNPVLEASDADSPAIVNDYVHDFVFSYAGTHTISYYVDVPQPGGGYCRKEMHRNYRIPLVAYGKLEVECGTGSYDLYLKDISSYIKNNNNETRSIWRVYSDPSLSGTYYVGGSLIYQNARVNINGLPLTPGDTYYVIHTAQVWDNNLGQYTAGPCSDTFDIKIPVWPTVTFTYDPSSICEGLPVEFNASVTPSSTVIDKYLWDFNDGALSAVDPTYRVYTFDAGLGLPPNNRTPTLTITDHYGCDHTSASQTMSVWENDLFGTVSGGTIVCTGPVTLAYSSGTGTPNKYHWSDEGAFGTSNTHDVNTSGQYFVTVEDIHACRWVTQPADVTIINLPNTGMKGRTEYCEGETVFLSAYAGSGSDLTYYWERDGSPVGGNEPDITETGLAAGAYDYTVDIVYDDGSINCTTSVGPVTVTIHTPPSAPTITGPNVLDCQLYELELVGSAPGPGTLVWSNGATGMNNVIHSGGPYRLFYYDNNGCMSFEDILVPESPESYFGWFPDGCYEICENQYPFWIYGPQAIFDNWDWNNNGSPDLSGTNSRVDPYQIKKAGNYSLSLDNGLCAQTTDEMMVSTKQCNCPSIVTDYWFSCDPGNPGGYYFDLTLDNPTGANMDVTVGLQSGPVKPFKIDLPPGNHLYNIYAVSMQGPPDFIEIRWIMPDGTECFERIEVDPSRYTYPCTGWPSQRPGKGTGVGKVTEKDTELNSGMVVYPNPASQTLNIRYDYGHATDGKRHVMVYDAVGRRIAEVPVTGSEGAGRLDVTGWAQGAYIVIMEEGGKAVHTARVTITH